MGRMKDLYIETMEFIKMDAAALMSGDFSDEELLKSIAKHVADLLPPQVITVTVEAGAVQRVDGTGPAVRVDVRDYDIDTPGDATTINRDEFGELFYLSTFGGEESRADTMPQVIQAKLPYVPLVDLVDAAADCNIFCAHTLAWSRCEVCENPFCGDVVYLPGGKAPREPGLIS